MNINKLNYTKFNTQKKFPSNYRTSFALPFPLISSFPAIFSESKNRKSLERSDPYTPKKKHKKHVHFTKVIFSTFLVPFSVTFIN